MESFWNDGQGAWSVHGDGGLAAVISELETLGYDYERIKSDLTDYLEYSNVSRDEVFRSSNDRASVRAHPFTLANVHAALASGLSGVGQTIAFRDSGFDLDHPDLAGKTITCIDSTPGNSTCDTDDRDDHGTVVAVVAAGNLDGAGLMGIAPEADLLVMTQGGASLSEATDLAISHDAVSFSHSYGTDSGWDIDNLGAAGTIPPDYDQDPSDDPPDDDNDPVEERPSYDNYPGNREDYVLAYQTRAAKLDDYQDVGVVVWAQSNNKTNNLINSNVDYFDAYADMPYAFPELQEAWITGINANFFVDDVSGDITSVNLWSEPCGYSAPWCLTGMTGMRIAYFGDYSTGGGTSFVAPQIAAGVALLAEAFPDLSPAEWTARLLASANNEWFLSGGAEYDDSVTLGERDWGNNVTHSYSPIWGHGVMDLEAALAPIGELAILTGSSVSNSFRAEIANAGVIAPRAASGLRRALDVPVTVFDGLNTNFVISGSNLVVDGDRQSVERMRASHVAGDPGRTASFAIGGLSISGMSMSGLSFDGRSSSPNRMSSTVPVRFSFEASPSAAITTRFGFTDESSLAADLGGLASGGPLNAIGYTDLLGQSAYGVFGAALGLPGTIEIFSFSGENRYSDGGTITGLGGRYGFMLERTAFEVSVTMLSERGSYLGVADASDLWFGDETRISAGQFAFDHDAGAGLRIHGQMEIGIADEKEPGELISHAQRSVYSGFAAGIEKRRIFGSTDQLGLWVSQPMRIEQSSVTFRLPSGRTRSGEILYAEHEGSLEPDGRQIDVGLNYQFFTGRRDYVQLGLIHSFDDGHVPGAMNTAIAGYWRHRF